MKTKFFLLTSLLLGVFVSSCSDDNNSEYVSQSEKNENQSDSWLIVDTIPADSVSPVMLGSIPWCDEETLSTIKLSGDEEEFVIQSDEAFAVTSLIVQLKDEGGKFATTTVDPISQIDKFKYGKVEKFTDEIALGWLTLKRESANCIRIIAQKNDTRKERRAGIYVASPEHASDNQYHHLIIQSY